MRLRSCMMKDYTKTSWGVSNRPPGRHLVRQARRAVVAEKRGMFTDNHSVANLGRLKGLCLVGGIGLAFALTASCREPAAPVQVKIEDEKPVVREELGAIDPQQRVEFQGQSMSLSLQRNKRRLG